MKTKTFSVVTSISMALTLAVAVLCLIGIAITGLYPGIIVLLLVALIPMASKFYAKKIISKSNDFQRNYYTTFTIVNLLSILVVLWMTFVIVHDRVLQDCCWFLPGGTSWSMDTSFDIQSPSIAWICKKQEGIFRELIM